MLLIFILIILISKLGLRLSKKEYIRREKIRPFECGYTPKYNARLPFSIRFFLISLIFIVFDVELVLIFPFIFRLYSSKTFFVLILLFIFLAILILGLAHELNQGSLN
jgi:NADH-ubiquinone oxidoreductase chain 3